MRVMLPALRIVVSSALAAIAAAMDVPPGLVALPAGVDEPESWGGTAVVIGADGTALTLAEALPHDAKIGDKTTVVIPGGGRRLAEIVREGDKTTAVLLRIDGWPAERAPVAIGDSAAAAVGAEAWTAGNSGGAIEQDGLASLSRGVISGAYEIPADAPPTRGRMGRMLSAYRGAVLETDAGVNDGSQGGALLDATGKLIALVSLGQARERRLGTAIPMHLITADLKLMQPAAPSSAGEPLAFARSAEQARGCLALVRFERPEGLGNPADWTPRPPKTVAEAPRSQRDQLQRWWDLYYNQQQILYTDQPAPAIVVDAAAGLLVTAAGNLHGGAQHGLILLEGRTQPCELVAVNKPLDLALLRADGALPFEDARFGPRPAAGDEVALLAPVRSGARPSWTMTHGVISAATRHLSQSAQTWLQISARANYGSLGGAVIDAQGRVVGMAAMLTPESDWLINSGVAMALDGQAIQRALPPLKDGIGTAQLPTLGMGVTLSPRPSDGKPKIVGIVPGTGAEAAGLKAGDLLERVDGVSATSQPAVARALLKHKAGDRVTVEYTRDGKAGSCEVELSEFRTDGKK
jgi:S1-C subfamily serine protease